MLEIIFGFIAGNITGLGMGGGTILILLLNVFMNLNQHVSQATNLIFFIPTAIASIITNIKYRNIDFKLSKITIFFGIVGAIIGSNISQKITSNSLKKYFAFFILIIAIHEVYQIYKEYKRNKKTHNINKKQTERID